MRDCANVLAATNALYKEIAFVTCGQRAAVAAMATGQPCNDDVDVLTAQVMAQMDRLEGALLTLRAQQKTTVMATRCRRIAHMIGKRFAARYGNTYGYCMPLAWTAREVLHHLLPSRPNTTVRAVWGRVTTAEDADAPHWWLTGPGGCILDPVGWQWRCPPTEYRPSVTDEEADRHLSNAMEMWIIESLTDEDKAAVADSLDDVFNECTRYDYAVGPRTAIAEAASETEG